MIDIEHRCVEVHGIKSYLLYFEIQDYMPIHRDGLVGSAEPPFPINYHIIL